MDNPSAELPLEQAEEIDRLADEFERQFRAGNPPRIEDFLQRQPKLRAELLRQLLKLEIELRQATSDPGLAEAYHERFPQDGDIVAAVLSFVFAKTRDDSSAPAEEEDDPQPEQIGRYEIRRKLGRGGFGVVYLAHDPKLDRAAALKVPRRKRFQSAEQVTSFIEEARTAAQLNHPLLVSVYDVQEHDGLPYIVQEFIDGQNLGDWAATKQPSFEQIARVFIGIAEALGYAHQQGLTHCDLKLANVLMDSAGQPHVADFGLTVHEDAQALRKGEVFGTPATMAPEQVRGESHRLDGRTDIWAIGVMLYELLVGRRPFSGDSRRELFREIQGHDPKPPRQIDRSIPRELERICLKCLSKRRSHRYNTTDDLREDLLTWLDKEQSTEGPQSTQAPQPTAVAPAPDSSSGSKPPVKIIPKGLRSFDAADADFFLELLPGPHDRQGLPESIRFWKQRIEEPDPDDTFSVGLIYGPSGCGKSSLVKAGLLPKLGENVMPIYVEATADDTEVRLLKQLRKHIPRLPADCSLTDACAELRLTGAGRDRKVLLVIDQFEQWLHSHAELRNCQLVDALRQCEGGRLQAVLMVRDDFHASAHRLFQELDVPLGDGHNYALVERFDKDHARKVLAAFGRAFGKLADDLSSEQETLLTRAIDDLAEENEIISVRLALFAEMMKLRPWVPASLKDVGGVGGLGVAFLEGTFSAKSAPPSHRVHEQAIRGVLNTLLPETGSDIKGSMQSADQLRAAAGYQQGGRQFEELIHILDSELRLITPTDPERSHTDPANESEARHYQLTHDYLVPSVRDWLTRKQKETRRGRAELRLAELSAAWHAKPENRHLPNVFEWLNIRCLTDSKAWSGPQRTMLRKAARVHATNWGSLSVALLAVGLLIQQYAARLQRQTVARETTAAVNAVQAVSGQAIPFALEKLDTLPRALAESRLREQFREADGQQRLSLAYGLARFDQVDVDAIVAGIVDVTTQGSEVANIVTAVAAAKDQALPKLHAAAAAASTEQNWQLKTRLAVVAMYLGDTSIAADMLRGTSDVPPPEELENPLTKLSRRLAEIDDMPPDKQSSPEIRLSRAEANFYLDRTKDALSDLNDLAASESVPAKALILHALCLAREGSMEKAQEAVNRLASQDQDNGYILYAKILSEAWAGNFEEAKRMLEELIAGDPDDAQLQYSAACVAAQMARICGGKDPEEAVRLTRRAVELLKKAHVDLGYRNSPGVLDDPDLIPLCDDAEFVEMFPPTVRWDPVQRTILIAEFPVWRGETEKLAEILQDTTNVDIRSGISLALGSIERPDRQAKEEWQKVFAQWYADAIDSGTHSAAGWAMRQWGVQLPPLETTEQPMDTRDWWHTPLNLTMLRIPLGSVSGEDRPIVIHRSFWLSNREISIALFRQFMAEADPDQRPDDWPGAYTFNDQIDDTHPVQEVSWEDAVMFCNWLSDRHGFERCYTIETLDKPVKDRDWVRQKYSVKWMEDADGFRLPSEDEWEYACRAGTTTDYACGNDEDQLIAYAVFRASSTRSCGSLLCNAWGLFDMHGNVWEWCWDNWDNVGSVRVYRGGSWDVSARYCRSSDRGGCAPTYRLDHLGFRVARGPVTSRPGSGAESEGR